MTPDSPSSIEELREHPRNQDVRDRLMEYENVYQTAIGYRLIDGERTREPAIFAYVDTKIPVEDLPDDERIPRQIHGITIDVRELDRSEIRPDIAAISSLNADEKPDQPEFNASPARVFDRHRPIPGGVGISRGSGLGSSFPVRDSDGAACHMTNYHVIAEDDTVVDTMYQPSQSSVAPDENAFGEPTQWDVRIGGEDWGIVRFDEEAWFTNETIGAGVISETTSTPSFNRRVIWFGARQGLTGGDLIAIDIQGNHYADFEYTVDDNVDTAGNSGSIVCQWDPANDEYVAFAQHNSLSGSDSTVRLGASIDTIFSDSGATFDASAEGTYEMPDPDTLSDRGPHFELTINRILLTNREVDIQVVNAGTETGTTPIVVRKSNGAHVAETEVTLEPYERTIVRLPWGPDEEGFIESDDEEWGIDLGPYVDPVPEGSPTLYAQPIQASIDGHIDATDIISEEPGHFEPVNRTQIFNQQVNTVAVHDERRLIAFQVSGDNGIYVYDQDTWDEILYRDNVSVDPPSSNDYSMRFSPDGQLLASCWWGGGSNLKILDASNVRGSLPGLPVEFNLAPSGTGISCYTVSWSPDGSLLAVGTDAHEVVVYDTVDFTVEATISTDDRPRAVEFSNDGSLLAIGVSNTNVRVHRTNDWSTEELIPLQETAIVSRVSFSPSDSFLAIGHWGGLLAIHETSGTTWDLLETNDHAGSVYAIDWPANEETMVVGEGAGGIRVHLYDVPEFSIYHSFNQALAPIETVAFADFNRALLVGDRNGQLTHSETGLSTFTHLDVGTATSDMETPVPFAAAILEGIIQAPAADLTLETHNSEAGWGEGAYGAGLYGGPMVAITRPDGWSPTAMLSAAGIEPTLSAEKNPVITFEPADSSIGGRILSLSVDGRIVMGTPTTNSVTSAPLPDPDFTPSIDAEVMVPTATTDIGCPSVHIDLFTLRRQGPFYELTLEPREDGGLGSDVDPITIDSSEFIEGPTWDWQPSSPVTFSITVPWWPGLEKWSLQHATLRYKGDLVFKGFIMPVESSWGARETKIECEGLLHELSSVAFDRVSDEPIVYENTTFKDAIEDYWVQFTDWVASVHVPEPTFVDQDQLIQTSEFVTNFADIIEVGPDDPQNRPLRHTPSTATIVNTDNAFHMSGFLTNSGHRQRDAREFEEFFENGQAGLYTDGPNTEDGPHFGESTFELNYTIPSIFFGVKVRGLSKTPEGAPQIEFYLVDPDGSERKLDHTSGPGQDTGELEWAEVALEERTTFGNGYYRGSDLEPGTYRIGVRVIDSGGASDEYGYWLDRMCAYDSRYVPANSALWNLEESEGGRGWNTLHLDGGHLDGPPLRAPVYATFKEFQSGYSVERATVTVESSLERIQDEGPEQFHLQLSNDGGDTWWPQEPTTDKSVTVDFTTRGTGVMARVRLGGFTTFRGQPNDRTPRFGTQGSWIDSYSLRQTTTTRGVIDETELKGSHLSNLQQLHEEAGMLFVPLYESDAETTAELRQAISMTPGLIEHDLDVTILDWKRKIDPTDYANTVRVYGAPDAVPLPFHTWSNIAEIEERGQVWADPVYRPNIQTQAELRAIGLPILKDLIRKADLQGEMKVLPTPIVPGFGYRHELFDEEGEVMILQRVQADDGSNPNMSLGFLQPEDLARTLGRMKSDLQEVQR